jgi:hypothetical protein
MEATLPALDEIATRQRAADQARRARGFRKERLPPKVAG